MLSPLEVSAEDVKRRLDAGVTIVLMDARSPDEWDDARTQLKGSLRLRPAEVENHLRFVPQGRPIVTYDAHGGVSAVRAAAALVENGWGDVHPMRGGMQAGEDAGIGTEARAARPLNEQA